MKKILIAVFAVGISFSAMAKTITPTDTTMHKMASKKMDGSVMMKGSKMVYMMNGKTMPMTKTMTMKNGTMVMTNGTVKMKNGKSMTLKNGQCVDMDGKVTTMPMKME